MAGPGRTSYGGKLGSVWIRKKKKRRSYDGVGDDQLAAGTGTGAVVSSPANTNVCHSAIAPTKATVDVAATSGSDTTNTSPTSSSSAYNDESSTDDNDSSPDTAAAAPGGSAKGSRRRLVGWDEDLCRPIYEFDNPPSADDDNSEEDNGADDDGEEGRTANANGDGGDIDLIGHNGASASTKDLPMALSHESPSSVEEQGNGTSRPASSCKFRVARSYGGRKRGRAGLSAAAEGVLLDSKRTKKYLDISSKAGKATASATASPTKTETNTLPADNTGASNISFHTDSMLTPQPYGNGTNICNILDSDVQKSAISFCGDDALAASANGDDAKEKKRLILDLAQKKTSRRQYGAQSLQPRKSTTAIDDDAFSTEKSELDFSGDTANVAKLTQPSGQSSLSAARRFFEHLDKTSKLSLEKKDLLLSPELRRHRRGADGTVAAACIRTSRTVDVIEDQILAREYELYSSSSDITPLPLREYVKHRNEFFTSSTIICAGLLDDS
jgi:hypothetical protein